MGHRVVVLLSLTVLLTAAVGGCLRSDVSGGGEASVDLGKPYDLESVAGMDVRQWSAEELTSLRRNGFVVTDESADNLAAFYPEILAGLHAQGTPELKRAIRVHEPVLMTPDAVLWTYGRILTRMMRYLDVQNARKLRRQLEMSLRYVGYSAKTYPTPKEVWENDVAFLAVAYRSYGEGLDSCDARLEKRIPGQVKEVVETEIRRIVDANSGLRTCPVTGEQIDYSLFSVRGHYDANSLLKSYFRSRMWLAEARFNLHDKVSRKMFARLTVAMEPQYSMGVSPLTDVMGHRPSNVITARKLWPLAMYMTSEGSGGSDDRGEPTYKETVEALESELKKRANAYRAKQASKGDPNATLWGQLMPRQSPIGNVPLDVMSWRRTPRPLEVLAALHGGTARDVLLETTPAAMRFAMEQRLKKAREAVRWGDASKLEWLTHQVFESLIVVQPDPSWPAFMTSDAYRRKSLQTASAGWAEHRQRWVLYNRELRGLFGEPELDLPPGFVEPNVEFWNRMLMLVSATLSEFPVRIWGREDMEQLRDIVLECGILARKQLADDMPVGRAEKVFGKWAKLLTDQRRDADTPAVRLALIGRDPWNKINVYAGTARPQAIYCIMPWKGQHVLVRGAVIPYREFSQGGDKVLTNRGWADRVENVPQPTWTADFTPAPARDPKPGRHASAPGKN